MRSIQIIKAIQAAAITLAKAAPRRLRPIDGETAHSPFPYDAHFMERLRPDQVPRFLGCLTNPRKLETKVVPLSGLTAIQDRVDPKKVEAIRGANIPEEPVVIRTDGRDYVVDGHHRAAAAYLDGKDEIKVRWKDLTAEDRALKALLKGFERRPAIGDLVTVDSDTGSATNAPWTSVITRVVAASASRIDVQVAYDGGETTYNFRPIDLRNVETHRHRGAKAHWFFRKSRT